MVLHTKNLFEFIISVAHAKCNGRLFLLQLTTLKTAQFVKSRKYNAPRYADLILPILLMLPLSYVQMFSSALRSERPSIHVILLQ